jgi:hypothetical protein
MQRQVDAMVNVKYNCFFSILDFFIDFNVFNISKVKKKHIWLFIFLLPMMLEIDEILIDD